MRLPNNTPKQFSWYESKGLENPQVEDGNTPAGTNQGRIYTSDITAVDKYDVNYQTPIISAVSSLTSKGNDYSSIITVSYIADLASSYATVPGFFGSNLISVNDSFSIKATDKDYVRGIVTKVLEVTPSVVTSGGAPGVVENSFYNPTGFNGVVSEIREQLDGKILVGGYFTDYNGTSARRIIRLNSDGSVDNSFIYGNGFNSSVSSIAVQTDGKLLVGGSFSDYNGMNAEGIIRLNSDGSVDSSFVYGSGFDASIDIIKIQTDGNILVGGQFSYYDGTPANSIIRLNTDGSVDTSFVYGSGFDCGANPHIISEITIQSDNKILMGGQFTSYNGTVAAGVIRLNADGTIDTSFVTGTGILGSVFTIAVQSDTKILIGGGFMDYDGTPAVSIIRVNNDGSIDPSFVYGTAFSYPYISSIAIQTDGKIIAGGSYQSYNGTPALSIIRLNSDGSPDTSFVASIGGWGTVYALCIQADGLIIIGGYLPTTYNTTPIKNIVRVWPGAASGTLYTYKLQCSIIQGDPMNIAPKDSFLWKRSLVMDKANFNEANPPINLSGSLNYDTRELFFYWENVNKESREYRLSFRYSQESASPVYTIIKVHGNTANPATSLTPFINNSTSQISCIRIDDQGIDMNSNRTINIQGTSSTAIFATLLDNAGSLIKNEFYVYDCTVGTSKVYLLSEKMRPEYPSLYPIPNSHSYAEGLPAINNENDFYIHNVISLTYNQYEVDIFDAKTGLPIVITPAWKSAAMNTYIKSHDGVYSINLGIGYDGDIKAEVKKIPDNVQAYIDPQIPGSVLPAVGTSWAWSVAAIYDDINKQYTEWAPEDYIHF
jgi:uncharacterized delta-60 repeat protein